jgi:hypothetical protein
MARPRKHKDGLTHAVAFRLSESDHQAWLARVQELGLRPPDTFRALVNGGTWAAVQKEAVEVAGQKERREERRRRLYLLNSASNNLNQVARRANADYRSGVLSEAVYAEILASLEGIEKALCDSAD